jgi:hypothetical protein
MDHVKDQQERSPKLPLEPLEPSSVESRTVIIEVKPDPRPRR